MQPNFSFLLALVSFGAATFGIAQDHTFARQAGAQLAIGNGHAAVVEHDGALRAFGRHYKASFDRGVVFTPALGDAAPTNQDLDWRLQSIRRGSQSLFATSATAAPVVEHDALRVQLHHAEGFAERFEARPAGLEVSYEFAARPAGEGDLVVRARVITPLQARPTADGTLRFELPGVGGVTIGAVTGVDADGRQVRGGLQWIDGCVQMSLPAAFVDSARYPLVLDPLLGVEFQMGINDDTNSDVGYQHAVGLYLVAWQRKYSAFDHDIYAQFLSPAGVPQGGPSWIDSVGDVSQRPRIGTVPTSNQYVIVYEKATSPFGPFQVVCRTLQWNGPIGALTTVAAPAGNAMHHAVGCEITNADDEILVVYQTDSGIEVREVTVPPAGALSVSAPVVLSTSAAASEPEISRSGGLLGYWMAVWTGTSAADSELFAAVVGRSLTVLAAAPVPFTNNAVDDSHPAVDGDGSTFVVAYQQQEAPGSALHDIRGARLQFTGSAVSRVALDVAIETTPGQDETDPYTTWLGPKHCVVFVEHLGGLNTGIGGWLVDDTCVPCNTKIVLDGLNTTPQRNREYAPRVGGRWQFALNGVYDDGFITFAEADDVPPFTGSIICQQVEALGPGIAAVQAGPGCGNGGLAFPGGGAPFVIGSQYSGFYASGLEAGAVPFLSIALPTAPLGCGACTLTDPLSFRFIPNVAGNASSPFPVPCNPAFVSLTLEFQWVSFLTSQNPCPLAPGLSASNRVQITIGS